METAEAARAALYRYAQGADTRDWALLGSAFAEDAVLEMPGTVVHGRDAVVASLAEGRQPDAAALEATGYLMRELILHRSDAGFGYLLFDGRLYHTLENPALEIPAGTYKDVGAVKTVAVGFAPQLTLEAEMIRRGAFGAIPEGKQSIAQGE